MNSNPSNNNGPVKNPDGLLTLRITLSPADWETFYTGLVWLNQLNTVAGKCPSIPPHISLSIAALGKVITSAGKPTLDSADVPFLPKGTTHPRE